MKVPNVLFFNFLLIIQIQMLQNNMVTCLDLCIYLQIKELNHLELRQFMLDLTLTFVFLLIQFL